MLLQFFTGTFEESPSLLSDLRRAAKRNFSSLGGFWFDCLTSTPWNYLDYQAYKVLLDSP